MLQSTPCSSHSKQGPKPAGCFFVCAADRFEHMKRNWVVMVTGDGLTNGIEAPQFFLCVLKSPCNALLINPIPLDNMCLCLQDTCLCFIVLWLCVLREDCRRNTWNTYLHRHSGYTLEHGGQHIFCFFIMPTPGW